MTRPAAGGRLETIALPRWVSGSVDLAVTLLLWGYFTFGFVMLFTPFYLLAALTAGDRQRAFQRINHMFYRGFFLLCRMAVPLTRWHIDPALKEVRGAVVVCNHISYIDPLLLISLFARHTTIVKNRLFHIPVFGWMLGLAGYLPAASQGRLAAGMLRQMEQMPALLAQGGNLIVFPEGTRSRTGDIGSLNPGAFKIARLCRAPVAVAAVTGSNRLFTPGRFLFNTCAANKINVTLLARLTPEYGSPGFSVKELMETVRGLLASAEIKS